MSLSLTLPGISLSLCRSSAYAQLGALEVALTAAPKWSRLLPEFSRHARGQGFNVTAARLSLDIGRA